MWARARAQKRAKFGVLLDFFGLKEKNQKIMVDLFAFLEYNTQVKTNKYRVLPSFRNMKRVVSNEIDRSYRRRK